MLFSGKFNWDSRNVGACRRGARAAALAAAMAVMLLPADSPAQRANVGPVKVQIIANPAGNYWVALGNTNTLGAQIVFQHNPVMSSTVLSNTVEWSSSDSTIASVGKSSGTVTGVSTQGAAWKEVIITARVGPFVGSTPFLVLQTAQQNGLIISPKPPGMTPKGATQSFTAMATFTSGPNADVTAAAVWSSSDTTVATVSEGQAVALKTGGTTTISVAFPSSLGFKDSTTMTDGPAVIKTVTVQPAIPSVPQGISQQFSATGIFTDQTTQDITSTASWSSTDTSVAKVNSAGLATTGFSGSTSGSATIKATDSKSGVFGSTLFTVTPAILESIALTPASAAVQTGKTLQLTATGTYTDGPQDISSLATWSSNSTSLATVSSTGLVTGVKAGSPQVTASLGAIQSPPLTVTVFSPLAINTSALPHGNLTLAYSQVLSQSGGLPGYTWNISSGALPAGLNLSPSGTISGTPTGAGPANFTVQVIDSESPPVSITNSLQIVVGNTFYVDSIGGNDLNAGTSSSAAWKSLLKASTPTYGPGDDILLKAGDVWNITSLFHNPTSGPAIQIAKSNGTANAPITLGSYGSGSQPVIDGLNTLSFGVVINQSAFVVVDGIQLQNYKGEGVNVIGSANATIEGCTFKNMTTAAISVDGTAASPSLVVDSNRFTNGTGISSSSGLVRLAPNAGINDDNAVFSNNVIGDLNSHFGIDVTDVNNVKMFGNNVTGNGHDLTIESATRNVTGGQIFDNVATGANTKEGDGEDITLTGTNGFTVSGDVFRNFAQGTADTIMGIGGFNAVSSRIYNNIVMNIPSGSGVHFSTNSKNNVFYNNSVYGVLTTGFEFDSNSTGNVMKNNIVQKAGQEGIFVDASALPFTEDYNIVSESGIRPTSTNITLGAHSMTSVPKFTNDPPSGPNGFKLLKGSSAIDSGANLGAPFNLGLDPDGTAVPYPTIDQNSFGSGWERGAFVFRP